MLDLELAIGGMDANDGLVYEVEAYDFPNAVKRTEAQAAERQSGYRVPDANTDAPFWVRWNVKGATSDEVATRIAALVNAFGPDDAFTLREDGMTLAVIGRVVGAAPTESEVFGAGEAGGTPYGTVTITGTRYADWEGAEYVPVDEYGHAIDGTDHTASGGRNYAALQMPAVVHVKNVPGEGCARPRAKVVPAQASEAIVLAAKPAPPTGYQPYQDMQGVADTAALSGQAAKLTGMTATMQVVGTAAAIDTNAYRDDVLVLARTRNTATTVGGTKLKALSSVTGSGVSASQTWPLAQEVAASQLNDGYELAVLGVVPVPASEVPGIATGAGFGPASYILSQTDISGATVPGSSANGEIVTLPSKSRVTVDVYVDASGGDVVTCRLQETSGGTPTDVVVAVASAVMSHAASWVTFELGVVPAGTYAATVEGDSGFGTGSSGTHWHKGTTGWQQVLGDLAMKVSAAPALGFDSFVAVEMKSSDSAKDGYVDFVCFPPAARTEIVHGSFQDGQGCIIDNIPARPSMRRAYQCAAADGTAGPALNRDVPGDGFYLDPGLNDVLVVADTPKAAAPTTVKFSLTAVPTFTDKMRGA